MDHEGHGKGDRRGIHAENRHELEARLRARLAAILLNSRFLPMGVAVAPFLKGEPLRRALEGQAVVDASWALASRGGGRFDREFMIGATLPQVAAWICGTVIGVLSSDVVGDVERLGLDVIFPAFFMALLVDELRGGGRTIAAALIAAVLSHWSRGYLLACR